MTDTLFIFVERVIEAGKQAFQVVRMCDMFDVTVTQLNDRNTFERPRVLDLRTSLQNLALGDQIFEVQVHVLVDGNVRVQRLPFLVLHLPQLPFVPVDVLADPLVREPANCRSREIVFTSP